MCQKEQESEAYCLVFSIPSRRRKKTLGMPSYITHELVTIYNKRDTTLAKYKQMLHWCICWDTI